jgi:hypothetical protein
MKSKIRPLGHTLLELEILLDEMVVTHELQWGDVLALVHLHLQVHLPQGQEEFEEGGHPKFVYK